MINRRIALCLAAGILSGATTAAWSAETKTHKLALQISDNSVEKMNVVLNVAANTARYYSDKGEEVEIEIVAFNAGLHMLRADTSAVKDRIASFQKSMTNVAFKACKNTMDGMAKAEGKPVTLIADVDQVPSGVTHLIALSENGWTIVRP
jgi:intracellular sulfur oxidation DsrE/DsrF family protein